MIRHMRQTRPSNCGQTCIAMLTGTPVSMIEQAMHTRGCTSTKQIRATLARMGYRVGPTTRVRGTPRYWPWLMELRGPALLFVRVGCPKGLANHWAIWDTNTGGGVLDPALEDAFTWPMYSDAIGEGDITSYADIRRMR